MSSSALAVVALLACIASARAAGPDGGAPLIAAPTGYVAVEQPKAPAVALFTRQVWDGELSLSVERIDKHDGSLSIEAFARQLDSPAPPVRRRTGERVFELYEDITIESFIKPVEAQDPYAGVLGSQRPPRLSFLELKRFPPGGDAYRFYRCREHGAWDLLRGYRRALAQGDAGSNIQAVVEPSAGLIEACFGKRALAVMRRGETLEDIPKPSMYRLRIMARDEWAHGAERRVERESVWLRDAPDAVYAARYRAPERAYREHRDDFLKFLAALNLP